MLPADWEVYLASMERVVSARPETAPKKPQGVGKGSGGRRLVSKRQARAEQGQRNTTKAIYEPISQFNQAQTVDPKTTRFTTELGGNCERVSPTGYNTRSRA